MKAKIKKVEHYIAIIAVEVIKGKLNLGTLLFIRFSQSHNCSKHCLRYMYLSAPDPKKIYLCFLKSNGIDNTNTYSSFDQITYIQSLDEHKFNWKFIKD